MRRRTSGAGAAVRAALLDRDRELVRLYGHLMYDDHRHRVQAVMRRLDNGDTVEPIPGWALAGYVAGVDMWSRYRLGADDSITAY